jgi:hypothetical protein
MKDKIVTIVALAGLFFCMAFSINIYMHVPVENKLLKRGSIATAVLSAAMAAPCILLLFKKK